LRLKGLRFFEGKMEGKTILLVDDDATVKDMIRFVLEKEKYYVLEASNYSEAIEQLRNPIDLAIIDYVLPDHNGFEVFKKIREIKPELPAIIMTAYSTEDVVINALRKGVTEYIKKPLSLSYLTKKVSEMLGGEKCIGGPEEVKSRDEFIMDGIAAYMEEKYREDLTFDKLASMALMNRDKFCKVFKERFGQTSTSYLNSIRIKRASELLRNPNLNITDIAHFVGYGSVDHFERMFRKKYKVSPREYRKKAREGKAPQSQKI
jgi:YesN/AraC family two-component response regulator